MPVVMVLGGDPLCFFYGGLEAPYGVFEITWSAACAAAP